MPAVPEALGALRRTGASGGSGQNKRTPLLGLGLGVRDLVIENFRRDPDDATPSKTLVLDNARKNTIELPARSVEEIRRVIDASNGLRADGPVLKFPGPDGLPRYRLTGETAADAVVSIERGPVDYLRLNAT